MTVNVLGTEYKILIKRYDEEPIFERNGIAGYCTSLRKEIVVCDMATYNGWEHETAEDAAAEQRRMLRHEIVHAFLEESGLSTNTFGTGTWSRNEEMIDWFAIQGQKIYAAWREADALTESKTKVSRRSVWK